MLTMRRISSALLLLILLTTICGCTAPTSTPAPKPTPDLRLLTPEDVVTNFWSSVDNGEYAEAYPLAYHGQTGNYTDWITEHETAYGPEGEYIGITRFEIAESFPVSPGTFEGNFSAAQVILIDTQITFQGTNRTGTVQYPLVKTDDGWKIFGDY